jgi:hypothetical protein
VILDCSSYESVKKSLCEIFHTTEDVLLATLNDVENDKIINYDTLKQNVDSSVREKLGEPDEGIEVLWFHGTRAKDESSFYKHGILTKAKVKERLYSQLISLSSGLEKVGENPFDVSMGGKECVNDEGPFAFLIKVVAISAPGSNGNYTKAPEMVEDIAGSLLGENYVQLVNRFQEVTAPFIVSFLSKPEGCELSKALFFLKLIEDGETEIEAGSVANIFFNSYGDSISTSKIINIERV